MYMKEVIKKLLRETLLKESYGPFKDSTMVPDYEKLKNGNYDELPSYYRDMHAEIVYMSPKEYLASCAKLQDTSYEEQFSIVNGPNGLLKVNNLIDLIDSGVKLNMPYLNFVNGYISQEGRHRAKAAMDLGYTKIPVLVIEPKERESNISLSGKIGIWKDLTKYNYGYMVSFNLNDFREQIKLLNCISRNFEEYLLDPILSFYQYRNLYKEGLISIVKKENENFHTMNKMSEYEVHDLIPELPDEYRKLLSIDYDNDEETEEWDNKIIELTKPLMDLGMLFILEHNKDLLSEIFEYDNQTKIGYLLIDEDIDVYDDYSSAKDMLLNIKFYDDIKFYSYENGDLDKMDKSFIEKHKELLPQTLGGVRVR